MDPEKRRQREHRPQDLGPRVERRGRYWSADLRPWGGGRYTILRDPKHSRWPAAGERTEDEDIARRWSWKYVDLQRDEKRRRLLGMRRIGEPVSDAAQRFLDERERDVERGVVEYNTFKTVRTAVNHLKEHLADSRTTDAVDVESLKTLFDELLDDDYAAGTLHSYRSSLIVFFDWLGRSGDNPARALVLPVLEKPDARAWTDDEIGRLRESADAIGGHARLALEIGLNTGAREQELFALRWEDFSYRDRTVRIQRQLVHHSADVKGLKGKRARTALVLPDFEPFFRDGERGLVIARQDGSPIGTQQQRNLMDAILDGAKLNLQGVRWHALRHTYARRFIEMGGRFEELQKSLGHASISITENSYGHFHEDRAAAAARERIYRDGPIRLVG